MRIITAKQLKKKTGEVIRRIKAGKRLTLTYRGKPLAIIEPKHEEKKSVPASVNNHQKAWEKIETALNQTEPEFENWQEADKWVRKRS